MEFIRVLIADDHPVVRSGLQMAIGLDPTLRVVGEAANGEFAIETIRTLLPDVAILDIRMPVVDGISATRQIKETTPGVSIILLTAHEGEDLFRAAMDAGVNGYLIKDNALLEITAAVHAVSNGGFYVTQSMAGYLTSRTEDRAGPQKAQPNQESGPLSYLTPTERRMLALIAVHLSNKEIAAQLGLSVRTIENRRAAICEKLGLRGMNALLKFSLEYKSFIN